MGPRELVRAAAAGVSRTLHVERLEQLARTYPLTRLGNRRALEGSLTRAREALAAGRSVGVMPSTSTA